MTRGSQVVVAIMMRSAIVWVGAFSIVFNCLFRVVSFLGPGPEIGGGASLAMAIGLVVCFASSAQGMQWIRINYDDWKLVVGVA